MSKIGAPHRHFDFPIHGTKCASATWPMEVPTLGEVYREIIDKYGEVQLRKPVPGDTYRKMYNPLNDMDRPAFRSMPSDITILSPARLFCSTAYKYNGRFYMAANTNWEFEYEYERGGNVIRDWMSVYILTMAYMPTKCVPMNRMESNQLTLF